MNLRPSGICLALTVLAACPAGAETAPPSVVLGQPIRHTAGTVEVTLQAADGPMLSQMLGNALGGTVQVEGVMPAPVTLDLQGVSGRAALDAVAAAMHGSWRPVYVVSAGAGTAGDRRPMALGRVVTANLENVSARAALALVARAGGGTLALSGDLPKTVTLVAKEMPVEAALDNLAQQAEASWSVTYVIKPGIAPPSPQPAAAPNNNSGFRPRLTPAGQFSPGISRPGAPPNAARAFPMPFAGQPPKPAAAPGIGTDAAKMLSEGLTRVMQMAPPQRQMAVKDFATQLEQQFRQIQNLPGPRRSEQMAAMRPVYEGALRTDKGLTPDQRREFKPIIDVITRWMR
jgi:hypothetical protein